MWAEAGEWADQPCYMVSFISACLKENKTKIDKQQQQQKYFTTEYMNHSRSTHMPFMLEKLFVSSFFPPPLHVGCIELDEFQEDTSASQTPLPA